MLYEFRVPLTITRITLLAFLGGREERERMKRRFLVMSNAIHTPFGD